MRIGQNFVDFHNLRNFDRNMSFCSKICLINYDLSTRKIFYMIIRLMSTQNTENLNSIGNSNDGNKNL